MIFKLLSVFAITTFVSAGYIGNYANIGGGAISQVGGDNKDSYAYPRYTFNYAVDDSETGDLKSQQEERDGDVVRGSYSLKESDGTTRTVHYRADDRNGFNAVVSRSGVANHPNRIGSQGYKDNGRYTAWIPANPSAAQDWKY